MWKFAQRLGAIALGMCLIGSDVAVAAPMRFLDGGGAIGGSGFVTCYRVTPRQNHWAVRAYLTTTGSKQALKPNSITDGFIIKVNAPYESIPALGFSPTSTKIDYNPKTAKAANIVKDWLPWNAGVASTEFKSKHFKVISPSFTIHAGIALTKSGSRPIHFYDVVGREGNGRAILGNKSNIKRVTCVNDFRDG